MLYLLDGSLRRQLQFPLPTSDLLVPNSVRSSIHVVGDVMGPALANIDNLLRMPYGCGEQNMVGFSPNVFVLQYLEATNRDSQDVRQKAITHMTSGMYCELCYITPNDRYNVAQIICTLEAGSCLPPGFTDLD